MWDVSRAFASFLTDPWPFVSFAPDLWVRSGCGRLPSWTSSLAWTKWRNLSGPRPPCCPVCQRFPWTKDQQKQWAAAQQAETGQANTQGTQDSHIFLYLIYPDRLFCACTVSANPTTCIHSQYSHRSTVSFCWPPAAPLSTVIYGDVVVSCSRAPLLSLEETNSMMIYLKFL